MDNQFSHYSVCKKTVMDSGDPNIKFDEQGISNHYWDFQNKIKPIWDYSEIGKQKLAKIVSKIKYEGRNNEFDCIAGLSGGADSCYMLHKMVTEFGLRPLVFHVDGGWNSEIAVNNINNLVDKLGLDLFTEVINWQEMRDFQLAMFKSGVPHLDIPQDMSFVGVLYKYASKYNIKYILNGGNISTECVQTPLNLLYWGTDMLQIRDILKKYGSIDMSSYPFSSIFYHKIYLSLIRGIKVVKPLNFIPYIINDAQKELSSIYNWKPYKQKHFESRFTQFFESYWLPTRFGYDMRRRNLSSLILTNQTTRENALTILESLPYDKDSIENEMEYIANKLEISISDLNSYHQMPKSFYWDYKNNSKLIALGEKVLNLITGTRRGGAI